MDLHDIRAAVAPFLSNSDLTAAALVCKSWNTSFTPFLYCTIHWYHPLGERPSKDGILRNARYIRHLTTTFWDLPTVFVDNCTNLRSLGMDVVSSRRECDALSCIIALVQRNPGIRSIKQDETQALGSILDLENDYRDEAFKKFLLAVSCCLELRVLHISTHNLNRACMEPIFDTAVRLERLTLQGSVDAGISLEKWSCFPVLKELKIGIDATSQLQLGIIRRCPQLRTLDWSIPRRDPIPITDACDIFKTHCPLIEQLTLATRLWSSKDISQILDNCHKLSSFGIYELERALILGDRAFQSLSRHFSSLRELRFHRETLTSRMMQQVMTNCPNLTILGEGILEACDILGIPKDDVTTQVSTIQPQDWVCTNLKTLEVVICGLKDRPHEWHRGVFQQLSRLTKLEKLHVGEYSSTVAGLDLRLETGLGVLASLKLLQELKVWEPGQRMEEHDVRWMLDAWPKLQNVYGNLHPDGDQRSKLRDILSQAGVDVSDYDGDFNSDYDFDFSSFDGEFRGFD